MTCCDDYGQCTQAPACPARASLGGDALNAAIQRMADGIAKRNPTWTRLTCVSIAKCQVTADVLAKLGRIGDAS